MTDIVKFSKGPLILKQTWESMENCPDHPFDLDSTNSSNWGIQLDQTNDGGVIQGTLHSHRLTVGGGPPIDFTELQIVFQAFGHTKFEIEMKGVKKNIFKQHIFYPRPYLAVLDTAPKFPYSQTLIENGTTSSQRHRSQSRKKEIFPFKINLDGSFPSSFVGPYGLIVYDLFVLGVVSWKLKSFFVIVEKFLLTKGHINLSTDVVLMPSKPVSVTKETVLYANSQRGILRATFELEQKGFLPNEILHFSLHLDNPVSEYIGIVGVSLVQKITYFATTKRNKVTSGVVQKQENLVERRTKQVHWKSHFTIQDNFIPSFFSQSKPLAVFYTLQFSVQVRGKIALQGEIPITIGTTRDPHEGIKFTCYDKTIEYIEGGRPAFGDCCYGNHAGPGSSSSSSTMLTGRSRSNSLTSLFSEMSFNSLAGLMPPSYSIVASRRPSIETLPPGYDEAVAAGGSSTNNMP